MRLIVIGIGVLATQLAGAQAPVVPFVPRITPPASMSAMSYRPIESAIGWLDSGRTLVFAHVAMYWSGEEEWSLRCKESGVFALDVSHGTIRKLYGFDQIRTTRGPRCPFLRWDGGALSLGRSNELLYGYEVGEHRVHRIDLTNGTETEIGRGCDYPILSLRLSPDQQTVALVPQCLHARGSMPLAIMRLDGSHLHVLAPKDTDDASEPSWSPDGRRLVYARSNGKKPGIGGVDIIDTSGVLRRILGPGGSPDWSPTDEWIAYLTPGDVTWFESVLHIVHPDGTGDHIVLAGQAPEGGRSAKGHPYNEGSPVGPVRWSPDGRTIALGRVDSSGTMLWRLDVQRGTMTQLTSADGQGIK
jgi:hypothetical protein